MDEYVNKIKGVYQSLCTPSKVYLFLQIIFIIILFLVVPRVYVFKIFYIVVVLGWVGIYDALCKNNYEFLSWALVLGIIFGNILILLLSIGKKIIN